MLWIFIVVVRYCFIYGLQISVELYCHSPTNQSQKDIMVLDTESETVIDSHKDILYLTQKLQNQTRQKLMFIMI